MSDPADAGLGEPAPLPRQVFPAPEPAQPQTGLRRLSGQVAIDVLIALLVMLAASIAAGAAWAAWRIASAIGENGGQAVEADRLAAAMGDPGALAQILMAIASMATPALVLYFWRRRATAAERHDSWRAARTPSTWAWTALVAGLVFGGSSLASGLMQMAGVEPVPTNLAMVEEASRRWPVFLFLFAVVLAPVYEELLFRRVLFGRFVAAGRPWLGLVVSSLAFALMHEIPGVSANPPGAVAMLLVVYAGMGAAFAWVYHRTGTLWAPIVAHGLNNAVALLVHGLL